MSRSVRVPLTLALLMAALLVLTYLWVTIASDPIGFLYGRTPGFSTARNITQIATIATAAILFIVALIVAIPTALQPGNFLRKMLYALPLFCLLVTLAGALANLLGIGTVGAVIGEGPSGINFATLWIAAGAVLSAITVVIAAATAHLSARTVKLVFATMPLTGLASVVAAAAMVVTVFIVSTNQPTQSGFGRPEGEQGARAQGTRSAAAVGTPAAAATQQAPAAAATPRNGGAPGGTGGGEGRPQGGEPGGPGGRLNTAAMVQQYTMGGALMAIFALIELVSLVGGWRATRAVAVGAETVSQPVPAVSVGSELGRAIVALLAVAVVVLVVIQLVPVSRTNPPAQAVAWDSPETQALWTRTCADCHSNDTRWPWYSSIAPSSWLMVTHINAGRQEMNVSELDKMPAFRKANLANDMAQQIRSGNMPPKDYLILHPDARLSDAEKQQLIQGLQKTFAR